MEKNCRTSNISELKLSVIIFSYQTSVILFSYLVTQGDSNLFFIPPQAGAFYFPLPRGQLSSLH